MTAARIIAAFACLFLIGADHPAEQLVRAEREAAQSAVRIRQLDQAALHAVDEAARYNAQAAAVAARVQQAEAVKAGAEARVAVVDTAIARHRARLAERQGKIVHLLAALESLSRRPPALALVQPGSIQDTAHVALLLDGVLPVIRARTADLRNEIATLRALKDRATSAQARLAAASTRLNENRLQLARMEQAHRKAATGFATESMLESDRSLALSVEAKDLKQLIGSLGSQARLREQLASLPGPLPRPAQIPSHALPPPEARLQAQPAATPSGRPAAHLPATAFILPALGEVATGFGELSSSGVRSRGLTLRTRAKAQVVAPAAGRIAFAGPFREYGKIVIIEHDRNLTTLLAGMDRLDARAGQTIAAGGPIGRMGQDKRELMLEIRDDGEPVNPLPLVTGR